MLALDSPCSKSELVCGEGGELCRLAVYGDIWVHRSLRACWHVVS